ncbi:MAG: amidohydrolase [Acetatifactor sp.]|nr:amidohydrolase [Acetatifactor sp.]
MKIIDAHIHLCQSLNGFGARGELRCIGGGYVEYADGSTFQMFPEELGEDRVTPEAVLSLMDREGIEKAVMLQGNFIGPQNLYTWEAMQKYPDRFTGAACYDPFCRKYEDVRRHLFEDLGFPIVKFEVSDGSGLMSYHREFPLEGEMMEEQLRYAEFLGLTVVFDIGRHGGCCWQVRELATAAKRYPGLQFVVCHLLAPQGRSYEEDWREAMKMLNLDNVVFDLASLSGNQRPEPYPYPTAIWFIKEAMGILGADRMMWGSDLPSNLCRDTYRHLFDYILESHAFTESEKESMLWKTADRIYFTDSHL